MSAASPVSDPLPGVRRGPDAVRLAAVIDHTLLAPEATERDIALLCDEALEHRFAAVCVDPVWVPRCRALLDGRGVKVATVIDFPLGASRPEWKADTAARAVDLGADELDVVAAIGQIRAGRWQDVTHDVEAVVRAVPGRVVKVIIESAVLQPFEIVKACTAVRQAGAHYVKTSTGVNAAGGATEEAVALMRLTVGDALGVKASGGIRDGETAFRMLAAGATRIGTSHGVAMAACVGPGPASMAELLAMS